MDPVFEYERNLTRRTLLGRSARGIGGAALASLLYPELFNQSASAETIPDGVKQVAPRAKRIIYLFQSGGPSHVDLFDYKPVLRKLHGSDLPDSVKGTQRVTGMTARQKSFPVVAPFWEMKQCGQHQTWISEQLPHTQTIADDITIIKSLNTEAINHDPAITYINTGSQQIGHASMGAWLSYGLGSENENLPAYMVMLSQGTGKNPGQPLFDRLWGSGYLPPSHQGVKLRPGSSPVLYLANPAGIDRKQRRKLLDDLATLNRGQAEEIGDPEIQARINSYEMAYRMQTSVPELMDLSGETQKTFEMYGPESRKPGSFAANCLLARRMTERGVRFVQLFHRGWDQHVSLKSQLPNQCLDVDQPSAALIKDLKQRGLLDETLVIWGGEFGRTVYSQGAIGSPSAGRDHHGRCFSIWMAGGGIKGGFEYGKTDDFCYNIAENPVHIRDMNATILHCMGIDHRRLTYKYRGLDARLTGVEEAHVVHDILS
ncbi:DUF1501 domain-containing protein [Gimesia panareensis]|uniref:Uncharacterized protein n=1 Tax=Gimesia panareensis TaxID=2527978 RepID=A0A518A9M4_9PLAN|nr:DUF1501 domain-containing protein [Gimesia panareensis]QDT28573.1 hypothetical protein Enr10x_39170 [Gimesia panareensis]QDU51428.1 hypothetical protein Pan110_37940 [Gimesia panareensis]